MTTIQSIAGENEQHPDVALVETGPRRGSSAYATRWSASTSGSIFRIAQLVPQNREDAEDVMQDTRFSRRTRSSISFRELEILHMVGSYRSQREPDAVAQAAHRQDGFDRRGSGDRRGYSSTRPGRLGSRSRTELQSGRSTAKFCAKPSRDCRRGQGGCLPSATSKACRRKEGNQTLGLSVPAVKSRACCRPACNFANVQAATFAERVGRNKRQEARAES